MQKYFKLARSLYLLAALIGGVHCVSWAQSEGVGNSDLPGLNSPRSGESSSEWSVADLAFKEVFDSDPNYDNKKEGLSVFEAVKIWEQLLEREDLTRQQRIFAWWRLGDLYAFTVDVDETGPTVKLSGPKDHAKGGEAYSKVLELSRKFVSFESLNAARLYPSLRGNDAEKIERLSEAFNWLAEINEEDIKTSASQVHGRLGRLLAKKFRNIPEGTLEDRVDSLKQQYAESRQTVSDFVTQFVSRSRKPETVVDLLNSIEDAAGREEMEQWREVLWDLRMALLKERISKFIPELF